MDFFGSQSSRQKQSALLLLFFCLAMALMALVVHLVAVLFSIPGSAAVDFYHPSTPALLFIALIWFTCLIGCFFRILDVRSGGVALAKRFGAVEAVPKSRFRKEQELLDIVAEVAIASASEPPRTFILHRETAINAFVVGGFNGKEALVVSQGAIDRLSRDELTAVVAHEFGHITQGDVPMNMRLLVALGGLNAIDEVGKLLMVKIDGKMIAQPGFVVGLALRCIGSVGVFSGRLIRSAFSRQREYLADACAVQYTRNPEHLAAALSIVRDEHDETGLHNVHAEELAHVCFQMGDLMHWYDYALATHPPLQKRIDAIDPNHATKMRSKKRATSDKKRQLYSVGNGISAIPMSGRDSIETFALSDQAEMLLSDTASCLAALHALFVSDDMVKSRQYYSSVAFAYNKVFAHQVEDIRQVLSGEISTNQIAIIEATTAQLRTSIKLENRQRLLKSLEKLLVAGGEFTLINYATLQLIRRKLDAEFPLLEKNSADNSGAVQATQAKTFDTMGREFALLLSLIVESSGHESNVQDAQFTAALQCYTKDHHARRSADEPDIVKELEASFQTLYVQPKPIREAFVQHCLELAQSDGHIAKGEKSILDLFAASLDCQSLAA